MQNIDLTRFSLNGAKYLGDDKFLFPKGGATSIFTCFPEGTFCGIKVKPTEYLTMDITACGELSAGLCWQFWESESEDWCDLSIKMGVLPNLKTRIALPFSELSAKTLFLPRTPGKLKTVVQGHPISLDKIRKFAVCVDKTPANLILKIENVRILDSEPEYPFEEKKMVDSLGQKKLTSWAGKTKDEEEMKRFLLEEAADTTEKPLAMRSRYGGWLGKRFEKTGFFGLENDGKRWWLKDPDGYAFFSMGFDCVGLGDYCNLTGITKLCESLPGEDEPGWHKGSWNGKKTENFNFFLHNIAAAFGEDYYGKWADMIRRRLVSWGCNTIACWSDMRFIEREKMPYVVIGPGYPCTDVTVFRDFPDVYSPEFKTKADEWAHFLDKRRDDVNLIGYFMSNEPQWAFVNDINLAAFVMSSPEKLVTREHIINSLREKYGTIEKLNAAWDAHFTSFDDMEKPFKAEEISKTAERDLMEETTEMIRNYIKIPAEAARRADPNHLNLGIRYAWLSSKALAAGCEYTDIFSFNCYSMDPYDMIDNFSKMTGKPVMIGEFHFGALDRGLDATGLRGVENQHERGVAYRRYLHRAASHPMCLGAHYFILYDQPYLGRFDGENYQIGVLDVCSRPYSEFLNGIVKTHSELYDVADGKIPTTEECAKEIEAIAF